MISFGKRSVSLLIAFLLTFSALAGSGFLSSFELKTNAFTTLSSNPSYTINGVTVKKSDVSWPGPGKCYIYAMHMYYKIWGVNHDSSFTGTYSTNYNMLLNLKDKERETTAANTEKFIKNAQPGAVIRITNAPSSWGDGDDGLYSDGTYGHSLVLADRDANGFTVFESWSSGTYTHYYTYSAFAVECKYKYFKYIKWPQAVTYGGNIDYTIKNHAVKSITRTSAVLSFSLDPDIIPSSWGFYVSQTKNDIANSLLLCKKTVTNTDTFSCDLSEYLGSLNAGRTYYYKIWAVVAGKTITGPIDSFSTVASKLDTAVPALSKVLTTNAGTGSIQAILPSIINLGTTFVNSIIPSEQ